jgi:hypothetical protein
MLSFIFLVSLTLFSKTSAYACTRGFLQKTTDAYLLSQRTGNITAVSYHIRPGATYTENGKAISIKNSTLTQPITYDYAFSAYDTVHCSTFTEIIAASDPHSYVIHTRMEFINYITNSYPLAVLIQSIVTDAGDWLFNATGTLDLVRPESWAPIPAEKQDTRATVQAVGDSYFDRFGNVSVTVPWGPPCYRVEGGLAAKGTLHNDTGVCQMMWPSTIHIPYRNYVVDEELGVASMFVGFPGLDSTQGGAPMPDSHLFRVEGGKIKYLHTASACVTAGCGLNGTFGRR